METGPRKTGISVVGDLPWGTHFCTFYETKQDLLDILVPYFKTGLESKEFCLWIVSNSELITTEEAKEALGEAVSDLDRYLAEGRIEVVSHDQWFLKNGAFDFHRVAYGFKEKLDEALANGFAGLRINGSPAWIQAEDPNVLREFEGEADHFFANQHIIASCTYPLGESRTDFLLDVARNHQFTIARRHGKWDVLETPRLIQAKQEIQRLNEDLEQRVIERTRDLAAANEELRKEIAERKRAEDALRRNEDRLRLAIDTTPVMAWSIRPDGVVDFLNQRWMDYTGLSLEQYVQDPTGPVHPEDLPRVVEKWSRNMAAGEPNEDEMRLRRDDGEYRWFLVRNAPLRDEQGNVVKWYGVSIDIEKRKRAEEALKESQRRLEEAQRIAHVGHWDRDLETGLITWSDEIYRILGLPMQEGDPPRKEWLDVVHPEDRPRLSLAIEELERGIQRLDVEFRIVRPNGEVRFLHSQGDVIRDERGRPLRRFGTAQDVTERRQAEEKLLQSERQLAEAQRLAHIGSWDWDLRTNAVTWSDELYHIFGLQPGTISVAGEVDRFIHPDDLDLGWDTVKRAVASKEPYDYYHRILRPDGTERIARSRGSIMSDNRGEPIRVFGATQDVTELKRAEEKLKATTEQLRALSASLQSAREEEGTRIAREIHDELGGALTSLKWDLESLDKVVSGSNDPSLLQALHGKVEAMLRLSETTISAVRRISSELRPSVLDDLGLAAAIEWQARQFQTRTGIICHCEGSVENLDLDREQSTAIFRILQEALTNILRHAQATRVEIDIKEEAGEIVLTVSDNGRGITADERSRLQSLGLLGMRERAHLIGGALDISGVEAQATVVTVRVPKAKR